MAACQDVINRAVRKLNIWPIGVALPAPQLANGLTVLQSIYMELVGWGAFGKQNDILANGDWATFPQQRVRMKDPNGVVSMPDDFPAWVLEAPWWRYDWQNPWEWPVWPNNPSRCVAPRDMSVVTVVAPGDPTAVPPNFGEQQTFIYDAFVGRWNELTNLTLTSEAPLTRRWFEPMANTLADRLAPDYGRAAPATPTWAHLQGLTLRYDGRSEPVATDSF